MSQDKAKITQEQWKKITDWVNVLVKEKEANQKKFQSLESRYGTLETDLKITIAKLRSTENNLLS